ncbi:unnamed protein product [Darwinula stevensoni]|uniref:Uncharacterized protein n=1 Tax=Darwinula stevensoni TaxID=69355 RepID=A0A7R8XGH8_9CRUS|nr:unnamed protein product [Darwinula stevensoni]CAG0892552.1 unnamed protein product [Darwinula stevensoni]
MAQQMMMAALLFCSLGVLEYCRSEPQIAPQFRTIREIRRPEQFQELLKGLLDEIALRQKPRFGKRGNLGSDFAVEPMDLEESRIPLPLYRTILSRKLYDDLQD